MPGLFDGMRISVSGIRTFRILEELVANNVANASRKDYTRQEAKLDTLGTAWDGQHFLGQGVTVSQIVRVRDELLDEQLRNTQSASSKYKTMHGWLERLQATYNEPSDSSIGQSLSDFWSSWSELATHPGDFSARANVIKRSDNLAQVLNQTYGKLSTFGQEIEQQTTQTVRDINDLTGEIAALNHEIFQIEAGRSGEANDLRDRRDSALNALSERVEIQYTEDQNGMVYVSIGGHPAVIRDNAEELHWESSLTDASQMQLVWEYGERYSATEGGALAGILTIRDSIIPQYQNDLDTFAQTLISEVNKIYSNGVALEGTHLLESRLGYAALGVEQASDALSLIPQGEHRSLYVTFHNEQGESVRAQGILVSHDDSLQDIADKLNAIRGLNASLISSSSHDGKLKIELDSIGGTNTLGESQFVLSNPTGGYDSSGVLSLIGLSQTEKSSNSSASVPTLTSVDLSTLQTAFGVTNVTDVRSHVLNKEGRFTLNLFETATETPGKTDGRLMEQLTIQVEAQDSIDSILAKINGLTADYGLSATLNGSNQIELSSTAQTDANGNVVLASGTHFMRLGLSNGYRHPEISNDEPPQGYTGQGDELALLEKLQMNTLFMGSSASDIALDNRMNSVEKIHGATKLAKDNNQLALAMTNLQQALVTNSNQFTIDENYANIISGVGSDVQKHEHLANNEELLLEEFITERDRISGVNLDEEMANMILFQRAFEANARVFQTFNQLAEELLQMR